MPVVITANESGKVDARCGSFEVSFTNYPQTASTTTSQPSLSTKLIFSKLSTSTFPTPAAVISALSSILLPKRVSFPGGEDVFAPKNNKDPLLQLISSPTKVIDQRPLISVKILSGYFDADDSPHDSILPLSGIMCELLYLEVRNSSEMSGVVIGDNVGYCGTANDDDLCPVIMDSIDYKSGKGMPRDSRAQEERGMSHKTHKIKAMREAKKIARNQRDIEGYEHVRTWGKKRVQSFLSAYNISPAGIHIFQQLGVTTGPELLKVDMKFLNKVGEWGREDLLKKLDKEKLLNGIHALRDGTTFSGVSDTTGGVASETVPRIANSLEGLSGGAAGGSSSELRFTGLTPRENPLALSSADTAYTDSEGIATLAAPIVGPYVVRCSALGYFTATTEIVRFTQPRYGASDVGPTITLRLHPRLRRVAIALCDLRSDDPKKAVSRTGDSNFKGIPVYFMHIDTAARHNCVADAHGVARLTLPPGTYTLSVDMQVLVIPNPNPNKAKEADSYVANNAENAIIASSDWRSEIFVRTDGNRAVAKRKHFIMQAGIRVAAVINRKVKVIRERKKRAALMLQCIIRVRGVRRRLAVRKNSAMVLQKWYRAFIILYRFNIFRRVAINVQKHFRGMMGRKRAEYFDKMASVITRACQRWAYRIRLFYTAKSVKILYAWRRFNAKKKFRKMIIDKRGMNSAELIQRACYHGAKARHWYHAHKYVAVYLFAMHRAKLQRKSLNLQHAAAARIQTLMRVRAQIKKFAVAMRTTVKLQALFRSRVYRMRYTNRRQQTILMQSFLRHSYHRRVHLNRIAAVKPIQRLWKPTITRWIQVREKEAGAKISKIVMNKIKKMRAKKYMAVTLFLQRVWRGCLVRRRVGKWNRSAVKIQNLMRCDRSAADFKRRMHAVGVIRRFIAQSVREKLEEKMTTNATQIQRIMKGAVARRRVWAMVWHVMWIQKTIRGYMARRNYKFYRGVTKFQASFRGGKDRQELLIKLNAAKSIAEWGWMLLQRGKEKDRSSVSIQCAWRQRLSRVRANVERKKVQSSTTIQSWARSTPPRKRFQEKKSKAVKLQSTARRLHAQKVKADLQHNKDAAVKLQSQVRRKSARKEHARLVDEKRSASATRIQQTVRCFLASMTWKNYGSEPFNCAVTITSILAYFEGAVEIHREDVEWFIQLSHVNNTMETKHRENTPLAIHRTTVMDGGSNCASKVESKSFELFDCLPSHILHAFLFWRKKKPKNLSTESLTTDVNDFAMAGSGILPFSRLEARGGRFTIELALPVKKRRLSSGSFFVKEAGAFSGEVRTLVEMGFKAGAAAKALTAGGNLEAAAAILLEGGEESEEEELVVDPHALPAPSTPAYISLAVSPAVYPSSRSLLYHHQPFLLIDAPNFVNLDSVKWGGDALTNIAMKVQAMCVSSTRNQMAVNICSQNQDIIQWEFKGGRKVGDDGLLEEWAWRVEDGCGLYNACTAFVSGGTQSSEDGLICCGGLDGSLAVYKSDGLTDDPVFSGPVVEGGGAAKSCCVVTSEHLAELGSNVVLTAGDYEVTATYVEEANSHKLTGIEGASAITRIAVGFTCGVYVGRNDGSIEMYSLVMDRELVAVERQACVAAFPYDGLEEDSKFRLGGAVSAIALHRPRGAGDDLVYVGGGENGKIVLLQGSNLNPLSELAGHGEGCVVTSLIVDAAGRFLVSGARKGKQAEGREGADIRVWKTTSLECINVLKSDDHWNVTSLVVARGILWAGYLDKSSDKVGYVCCWGGDASTERGWLLKGIDAEEKEESDTRNPLYACSAYSPTLKRSVEKSRETMSKGWDEDGWMLLDDGEIVEHEQSAAKEKEGVDGLISGLVSQTEEKDSSDSSSDSEEDEEASEAPTEETKRADEEETEEEEKEQKEEEKEKEDSFVKQLEQKFEAAERVMAEEKIAKESLEQQLVAAKQQLQRREVEIREEIQRKKMEVDASEKKKTEEKEQMNAKMIERIKELEDQEKIREEKQLRESALREEEMRQKLEIAQAQFAARLEEEKRAAVLAEKKRSRKEAEEALAEEKRGLELKLEEEVRARKKRELEVAEEKETLRRAAEVEKKAREAKEAQEAADLQAKQEELEAKEREIATEKQRLKREAEEELAAERQKLEDERLLREKEASEEIERIRKATEEEIAVKLAAKLEEERAAANEEKKAREAAEEEKRAREAMEAKLAEEQRVLEEQRMHEELRLQEEQRALEEQRLQEEQRVLAEQRVLEEQRLQEEQRILNEQRVQEYQRALEEQQRKQREEEEKYEKEKESAWERFYDESQSAYYFVNSISNETQWEEPKGWLASPEPEEEKLPYADDFAEKDAEVVEEEEGDQKAQVARQNSANTEVVAVEEFKYEGKHYLIDRGAGKVYSASGDNEFVGKLVGEVVDFEALDSDEDASDDDNNDDDDEEEEKEGDEEKKEDGNPYAEDFAEEEEEKPKNPPTAAIVEGSMGGGDSESSSGSNSSSSSRNTGEDDGGSGSGGVHKVEDGDAPMIIDAQDVVKITRPTISEADVGRKVRVHWDVDESYVGIMDIYNPDSGQGHVQYDDGDDEWLDPNDEETEFEYLTDRIKPQVSRNGTERMSISRRHSTASELISVEKFEEGGEIFFLDRTSGKFYNMDGEQEFVGKLMVGEDGIEKIDRSAVDSDDEEVEEEEEEEVV
jgi:hypothetical protein